MLAVGKLTPGAKSRLLLPRKSLGLSDEKALLLTGYLRSRTDSQYGLVETQPLITLFSQTDWGHRSPIKRLSFSVLLAPPAKTIMGQHFPE